MIIRFTHHENIDMEKWDKCVDEAVNRLPYAFSWYLDTVAHGWHALIADDYRAVFPVTAREKYGIHYLAQPPFTQQLGVFSKDLLSPGIVKQFIEAIPKKYKLIEIKLNKHNLPADEALPMTKNVNLELPLISAYKDLQKNYSKNLKRNLKKAQKSDLTVVPQVNPVEIIRMFQLNRGRNINTLKDSEYTKLEQLIYKMAQRGYAQVRGVYTERNSLCAAAVFFKVHDRIIFLFSGLNEEGKQVAAMPYLIDSVIQQYAGRDIILDFEGSNDTGVARFYRSFGASECIYPGIKIYRFPKWMNYTFKLVKKLR
ncbi:MAG: hypothetical protein ACOCPM_00025 [Bacteroidales bacterium]